MRLSWALAPGTQYNKKSILKGGAEQNQRGTLSIPQGFLELA